MNERETVARERAERRLTRWIHAIAAQVSAEDPEGIMEHIQKHALKDLDKHRFGDQDWKRWSASMHNLLDIFDVMYDCAPTPEHQVERLQAHYDRHPSIRTPEPV